MIYDIEEIRSTYKDLFEYSLDLVFVNTFDGKFIYANDLALNTLGYEREDIPNFSLSDIMDKDQLSKAYNALIELKKTGRQSNLMELRLWGKDGSTIYVETYVIPLYKDGKIYATLGIARNITDLRVLQKDLKQSEEKYRFLFETTPFSVFLLNSNGIIVDCNPMTEHMFGFNKIELIGRHFKNISAIHQKYLPELINLFRRMINREELHRIDIQMYKKDGSLIWANLQASILNIAGKLFVQAVFHDITERKEITQKLEESENLYRTLVETSPDAIIVTDLKGKIIEVSEKTVELSGGNSIEDIIGKNAFDLISPQDIPRAIENHQQALKGINPIKSEYTINRLDGSQYIGELNTNLINDKDGKPKAFIGIMRDITEQKNAEKLLKESEEQYRELYQSALVCLWTVRIQDTKIIRANKVSSEFTGVRSLEELINNYYVSDFFEPDVIRDIYKKLKISGEISGVETRFKDLMGNEKILSFWAKLYVDKGIIEGAFIDITNLKTVQKALRESEEKFRTITEQSFIGIIIIQNGVLVYVNETVSKIMGYNFQELKNWSSNDFFKKIHPEDVPIAAERFQKMQMEDIDAFPPYSYRVFTKSGKIKWIEVYSKIIHYQGNNAILATIVDVTTKKDAEQKLKESEEKYRHLFENSPNMIILLDSNGRILDVNTPFLNIFGFKEDEILGKNFQQVETISSEALSVFKEKFDQIFNVGILEPFELQVVVKDGILRWMSVQGSLIDVEDKKILQVIFQDINEGKVAEQKLKESEEKYRIISENANDLIIIIDKNFKLEYMNEEAHERVAGYSKNEIIGTTPLDRMHPEDINEVMKVYRDGTTTGIGLIEFRYRKKDGTWIWLESLGKRFLDSKGEPKGIIISRDITERKITEQKLRESEEKYRHLFENSINMIILLDSSGKILDANTYFLNNFNYKEDEIIGKNFQQLENISSKALSIYIEKFNDIFDKGILEPFELQAKVKGDFFRWMTIQSSLIDIDGKKLLQVIFQDINERKVAEQKLKESEEKYRIISENANDLITVINEKFRFEYINEEVHKRITGYSKEDLIGKSPLDNFHPDDIQKTIKTWRNGVISGEGMTEFRYKKKDGTWIWLEMRGKKFIDTNGEPKGVIISRDITQRKLAEKKLKESEEKYRHLFDSSPFSIGLLDLEGTLIESNNATTKFTSTRTIDELIGKNVREIFSSTEQDRSILPKLTEYIKEVIKYEIREPLEIPITRSNGNVMWISFYGSLIKIGDKTLLQFLGQDITDRKRAEQNLIKSEEKYRLLFENSPNAIVLTNSKGIILDFNQVTEKLLGFKREELISKNYTKISAPDHVEIMRKRYEDHLKGIPLKPMEFELRKGDGSYVWVNYQNKIIKLDDEDISISIIQDITKRIEAELIVKEELIKLKELDQIRKDLISRVSHELKTPLIPVISGTELLTTIYRDQVGEDALEIIEMIDKGGSRLRELVEKLINVSRIEYNKFEVRKETSNLSEIIKRSANGMKFLMEQRGLKLKFEIPDKLYLEMDELRIEEVITNLLSNAIKNTPPHGEINLSLRKEDNWAILRVSDTGVGLTEKEKNVLFTRFGKIERYEEGLEEIDVKGSGLGLYICKEIIQLHEGKIWAESDGRNKGSRFNVKLPIK